jgi:hypothetical protein
MQQEPSMKIGRNASSERANTVETSIAPWVSFGVGLFIAHKQHPKGDVLMFQRRNDNCPIFVSKQSCLE